MRKIFVLVLAAMAIFCFSAAVYADTLMKPPGGASKITYRDGSTATIDANGNVMVPQKFVLDAISAGFYFSQGQVGLNTASSPTLTVANMVGASTVYMNFSGQTAAQAVTTPTAAQLITALGGSATWEFIINNGHTSTGVITLTAGDANVTISGTATTAVAAYHVYVAVCNAGTGKCTFTSAGTGTTMAL
jgi:hypothetical protein